MAQHFPDHEPSAEWAEVAINATKPNEFGHAYFERIAANYADSFAQWHAIKALGEMKSRPSVPVLLELLRQPDVEVGETTLHLIVAWAFGRIGTVVIPELIDLAKSGNTQTAKAAVDALGEIGPNGEALEVLAEILRAGPRDVALWAALSLAKAGAASVPFLEVGANLDDEYRVGLVLDALAKVGSTEVIATLGRVANSHPAIFHEYLTSSSSGATKLVELLKRTESGAPPFSDAAHSLLRQADIR